MKKRVISMFLCLCMAFTLVDVMVPTASAASQKALTDQEITGKIDKYIEAVEAWKKAKEEEKKANEEKDTKVNNAYWNKGLSTKALKEDYSYMNGLNDSPCGGNNVHDSSGSESRSERNCKSNSFNGVGTGGIVDSQCQGFAAYIGNPAQK